MIQPAPPGTDIRAPARRSAAPAVRSRIEVDLAAVAHNVRMHRALLGPAGLAAAVKKDGYGLGAVAVGRAAIDAGASMLAVFDQDEAAELIDAGLDAPTLVLAPTTDLAGHDGLARAAAAGRLHLTVHEPSQVDAAAAIGRAVGAAVPVHLYVDTGMTRAGLSPTALRHAAARLADVPEARLAGVYSHFASAEDDPAFADEQHRRLTDAIASLGPPPPGLTRHLAASSGVLRDRRHHLDLARVGLGLLGYGDQRMTGEWLRPPQPLRPVVRWTAGLLHVDRAAAGSPVGYGSTHVLENDSVLGVAPVGYGDGYPLALSNRATVGVTVPAPRGGEPLHATCRQLGRVNMDQIVIDLTDPARRLGLPPNSDADLGPLRATTVELVSPDPAAPHAMHRLAELAGSSCYELCCGLNPRLIAHHDDGQTATR